MQIAPSTFFKNIKIATHSNVKNTMAAINPFQKRRRFTENICMAIFALSIIIILLLSHYTRSLQLLDPQSPLSKVISGYFIGSLLLVAEEAFDQLLFSDLRNLEKIDIFLFLFFLIILGVPAYFTTAWGKNADQYFVIGMSVMAFIYKHTKNGLKRIYKSISYP